jgi:hypothetical protein
MEGQAPLAALATIVQMHRIGSSDPQPSLGKLMGRIRFVRPASNSR